MIEDGPGSQHGGGSSSSIGGGGGGQVVGGGSISSSNNNNNNGASPVIFSAVNNSNSVGSSCGGCSGVVGGLGAAGMVTKQQADESSQRPQYSMPGILHFLQTEWARFEMERSQWEVERAELQARIAFLQGERKGQENLKQDLVRRIKMLEFALKSERAKYHKLKYGTDLNQDELKPPAFDKKNEDDQLGDGESLTSNNTAWRQGRQLLRQYLHEIGYTDTIIDVRSAKVRSLLGLQPHNSETDCTQAALINGEQPNKPRPVDEEPQTKRPPSKVRSSASLVENSLLESEVSVLATLDFLSTDNVVEIEDDNLSDENEDGISADDESEERAEKQRKFKSIGNESMAGMEDVLANPETEEALAEFDFLVSESGEGAGEARSQGDGTEWEKKDLSPTEDWAVDQQLISKLKEQYKKECKGKKGSQSPKRGTLKAMMSAYNSCEAMLENLSSGSSSDGDSMDDGGEDDSGVGIGGAVAGGYSSFTSIASDKAIVFTLSSSAGSASPKGYRSPPSSSASSSSSSSSYRTPPLGSHLPEHFDDNAPSKRPMIGVPGAENEALEAALGLGELAGLTVANEADPQAYDISAPKEVFRKTWNAKYTLRSHFDGVRSLAFHPIDPVLITASEDHTLKLWNLQKTVPAKKTASVDVEPVYTFRAHEGPVLCLAVSPTGEQCYSGGVDNTIRCWNIPISSIDPYDSFDCSVLQETLVGHTDAVWGLSIHSSRSQLLSCSADGSVRLWSPGSKDPLLSVFKVDTDDGVPTSVDYVCCDPSQMVTSYTSSHTYIFDIETKKQILKLDTKQNSDPSLNNQINRVINHPTLPVTITAHEDRHIRFFDNHTGKMVHSMVAHLDPVTSLAVDPSGLYLLSGSHDCSIRLWNLDSKTCVQEITSHRKKFDESIHDVAFHPSKPYIASAGADAVAKVFV
ncbi:striatin isoform X2 [Octopus bimaculoides]|uniref:striatin isoform X2 n=1 Tax=Octopus bimaculoides TaxID=37653 RepID=UPI0022E680E3|nr:striatin isoform X2 [Octopus bimaculoides]